MTHKHHCLHTSLPRTGRSPAPCGCGRPLMSVLALPWKLSQTRKTGVPNTTLACSWQRLLPGSLPHNSTAQQAGNVHISAVIARGWDVSEQAQASPAIPWFTYSPSIRSQWPVRTQIRTSITDRENESSSAAVKRPQQPKEILGTTHKH